jgi:haloalkane dehalogenase
MSTSSSSSLPTIRVLDTDMAYRAIGERGPHVLFLHGNPTSSFIWRDILPEVSKSARCIAPDLVGFGQSGKPAIDYRFADHVRYLDAFIETMGIDSAYLVAQDWGTALAFHLAARRPQLVRGLAFMEFIRPFERWDDFNQTEQARALFKALRTPGVGEQLVIENNVFIEKVLPASIARPLTDDEMNAYRLPFLQPEERHPMLAFPNEMPIAGEPRDVWDAMKAAHQALATSTYPKLLFCGNPGGLVSPEHATKLAKTLSNCQLIQLSSGLHFLQEDHPEEIARGVSTWIAESTLQ